MTNTTKIQNITLRTRTLGPIAIALLVMGTGCALDQSEGPTETEGVAQGDTAVYAEGYQHGVQLIKDVATDDGAADEDNFAHDTLGVDKEIKKSGSFKDEPGALKPEGESNGEQLPQQDPPKKDPVNPGDDKPATPVAPNPVVKLTLEQIEGLKMLLANVAPARLASTIDRDSFADFDFAGAMTTDAQDLSDCTEVNYDRYTHNFELHFDCSAKGDNAPAGMIICTGDVPSEGLLELSCKHQFTTTYGESRGRMDIAYEVGADQAYGKVIARIATANNDRADVESSFDTQDVSQPAVTGGCSTSFGKVKVATSEHTFSADIQSLNRCNTSCRPDSGEITFSIVANTSESSEIITLNNTVGSSNWVAVDANDQAVSLNLCQ